MHTGGIIISALLLAGVNAAAINPLTSITTETQTPPDVSVATAPIIIIGSQKDGNSARLVIHRRSEAEEDEEMSDEDPIERTARRIHNFLSKHRHPIAFNSSEPSSKEGEEGYDRDGPNTPNTGASLLPPRDPSELDANEGGVLHGRRDPKPQLITPDFVNIGPPPSFGDAEFGELPWDSNS